MTGAMASAKSFCAETALAREKAAVNDHHSSRRIARCRHTEKGGGPGNLIWLSPAFERDTLGNPLVVRPILPALRIDGRLDISRGDGKSGYHGRQK